MSYRGNIIYVYDGSFEGLLSAVFYSFEKKEMPLSISCSDNLQQTLDTSYFYVLTDFEKALRIENFLQYKISNRAMRVVFFTFLSDTPDKEMKILAYIHRCIKYGKSVNSHLNDKYVADILNASQFVTNEAHLLKGFIRFSELDGGIMYSEISPKNKVLPCLIHHFSQRFSAMPFIIHDLTHKECLVYNGKEVTIENTTNLIPKLNFTKDELLHRKLWKEFYDTVEIQERHNEKCQMTHMPKRYWVHLTEKSLLNE